MARTGVTYLDVTQAAEAIKTQGQEPTVDRVREHLGSGSKSTIAPLLKRWRTDHGETADTSGLPNDLLTVVKSLHERVQQMADHRIEQAREEFKVSNDELRKSLAESRSAVAQLTTHQQALTQEIERITREKDLQNKFLEETHLSLAKVESQRDEAARRVNDLKESVAELKQEKQDIRDHFEHYQQRTAEDRQQEREQFHSANQQLQDRVQDLKSQLAQAEERASGLLGSNAQLQNSVSELKETQARLNSELNRKTEAVERLNRELEAALAKNQKCQKKQDQLTEQVTHIVQQKTEADKTIAVLSQGLEATQTELQTARDQVVFLTDENRVLLQEKSVIQGQFKQLQDSLSE